MKMEELATEAMQEATKKMEELALRGHAMLDHD